MITLLAAVVLTVNVPTTHPCTPIVTQIRGDVQTIKCRGPGAGKNYPATARTLLIELPLPPTCELVLTGGAGKQTLGCKP